MAKKRHYATSHMEMRKEQGMHMDGGEYANLPQEVHRSTYMMGTYGLPEDYDDGISGIDAQLASDHGTLKKQFRPKKF